ncbi:MAG: hypothetical protein FWE32_08930 [Oscillospiraceae bacterium]|nr:hypothetical protein [Oscillospiraceae bacterium]
MKKILSLVLVLVLICSLGVSAYAQSSNQARVDEMEGVLNSMALSTGYETTSLSRADSARFNAGRIAEPAAMLDGLYFVSRTFVVYDEALKVSDLYASIPNVQYWGDSVSRMAQSVEYRLDDHWINNHGSVAVRYFVTARFNFNAANNTVTIFNSRGGVTFVSAGLRVENARVAETSGSNGLRWARATFSGRVISNLTNNAQGNFSGSVGANSSGNRV